MVALNKSFIGITFHSKVKISTVVQRQLHALKSYALEILVSVLLDLSLNPFVCQNVLQSAHLNLFCFLNILQYLNCIVLHKLCVIRHPSDSQAGIVI